ncbi:reverse transcriptase domain-containing protein [Tanacetum coccineum]
MQLYSSKAKDLIAHFRSFSIMQVPRSQNKKADALSKMDSVSFAHLTKKVLVEVLPCKSIEGIKVMTILEEEGDTWMTSIKEYLDNGTLLEEKGKARLLRARVRQYVILEGTLYRKSFLGQWQRCVGPEQANYKIREIHEGSCSMHSGPRSVITKAIQLGYYWPMMHIDARMVIRACQECQGIDIYGPFPEAAGKVKFLIVAIDYFTKWIEAKPVAAITGKQVMKFVWDNIVYIFGLLGEIVLDNGKQFREDPCHTLPRQKARRDEKRNHHNTLASI